MEAFKRLLFIQLSHFNLEGCTTYEKYVRLTDIAYHAARGYFHNEEPSFHDVYHAVNDVVTKIVMGGDLDGNIV